MVSSLNCAKGLNEMNVRLIIGQKGQFVGGLIFRLTE